MYQMMIDSPQIKNTTQNSPGNSHRTSARRIASIIAPRSSPWKTPYIVNAKITTRKTVFTIIFSYSARRFHLLRSNIMPYHAPRCVRPAICHVTSARSAPPITSAITCCFVVSVETNTASAAQKENPLIPARNLPSAADCDIAEPAVQAVNRWEQIVRRIHLVEQGKHLIPESLFRDRRPYVRCRQQQIKMPYRQAAPEHLLQRTARQILSLCLRQSDNLQSRPDNSQNKSRSSTGSPGSAGPAPFLYCNVSTNW